MRRIYAIMYSLLCYLVFIVASLWGIAFSTGVRTPAAGSDGRSPLTALVIDLGLLGLFGLQHTVMARTGFKRWWTRLVAPPLERSTYVVLASLSLVLLFWQWRSLPGVVWAVASPAVQALLWIVWGLGWLLVLVSTFAIDHWALTGVRQVWNWVRRQPSTAEAFRTPALYRLVRHPMMLGFLVAFWATPRMSSGQFLFAVGMSVYIVIGIQYEERDLWHAFGASYRTYQQRVPMLIPRLGHRRAAGRVPRSQGNRAPQS